MQVQAILIVLALAQIYAFPQINSCNVPKECRTKQLSARECCADYSGPGCNLHVPHETNCSLFYQCEFNKPTLKLCPGGTHFNPTLEVCDWPERAGCIGGAETTEFPITTAPTSTTTVPPTTTPINPPAPGECTVAICDNCRSGEFDSDICCSTIPSYYKIYWKNAKDCSSYFHCQNGKAEKVNCPSGLHWSMENDRCEWPHEANCSIAP